MSWDNSLGDLTNHPRKRGFSGVSDEFRGRSNGRRGKGIVSDDGNSRLAKRVPFGEENLEAVEALSLTKDKESRRLLPGIGDLAIAGKSLTRYLLKLPIEKNVMGNHSQGNPSNVGKDSRTGCFVEVGDASRDSRMSIVTADGAQANGKGVDYVGGCGMDAQEVNPGLLMQEAMRGDRGYLDRRIVNNDLFVGKITSSISGSMEWLRSCDAQVSKSFELRGDGCVNQSQGDDLLKTCSCSFCLKAAYIWSDLHFQDIKGRLSALGKSQREVASVIQTIDRDNTSAPREPSSLERTSKLESDLKNQWKLLFLHMQNALIQESRQSRASYIDLNYLRGKRKTDLEAIDRISSRRN